MVGAISGGNPYLNYYQYRNSVQTQPERQIQPAEKAAGTGRMIAVSRPANPDAPVEPVDPVRSVQNDSSNGLGQIIPFLRQGADPAEMAVRMRMQPYDPSQEAAKDVRAGQAETAEQPAGSAGIEDVYKTIEEGECQTCEQRKYQDGSDDPGVSFKTASHIAPEQAASAVRGHEMEHVVREQASAAREDRKVVSQTVSFHTEICPECGKVYVSGGTTRTVTAPETQTQAEQDEAMQERRPFFAVA